MGQKDSVSEIAADLIKALLQVKRSEVEDWKGLWKKNSKKIVLKSYAETMIWWQFKAFFLINDMFNFFAFLCFNPWCGSVSKAQKDSRPRQISCGVKQQPALSQKNSNVFAMLGNLEFFYSKIQYFRVKIDPNVPNSKLSSTRQFLAQKMVDQNAQYWG